MDGLPPDPGPPPSLPAHRIFVYLIKRIDALDDRHDTLVRNTAGWRYDYIRASRRSDYITIVTAVAHGIAVSAGWIGGLIAGSYVLVEHTWYWHKIVGWFHGI